MYTCINSHIYVCDRVLLRSMIEFCRNLIFICLLDARDVAFYLEFIPMLIHGKEM
jgi:hypothetical protein